MLESRYERRKLQYPELNHFQLSRESIGRTKIGLMNPCSKKYDKEFDARLQSVQSQEKQHPILNLYSKTKQFNLKPKRTLTSQIVHSRNSMPTQTTLQLQHNNWTDLLIVW